MNKAATQNAKFPYLPLREVERWHALCVAAGVRAELVGSQGDNFYRAYRRADGRPYMMARYKAPCRRPWPAHRTGLIQAHLSRLRDGPLFAPGGEPTLAHLELIALAFSPAPDAIKALHPGRILERYMND